MLAVVVLVTARCVFLDGVDQPDSVQAGEVLHVTLKTRLDIAEDRSNVRLVIGMLLPRSWRGAENMEMTYAVEGGEAGRMVAVPGGIREPDSGGRLTWPAALMNRFGIGANLIDDMEWVVFWTEGQDNVYNGYKQNITIRIAAKSGMQNMRFKTGYFVGSSSDGLSDFFGVANVYKTFFTDCFEVHGGEGDVQDFCNPQQTFVDPYRSTDNDIVTLTYDRDILPGTLGDEIYLCATAELADGGTVERCTPSDASRLLPVADALGRFEVTMWPRQYFGLAAGQTVERMTYHFMDRSGAIKLGYGNTDEPFVFTFRCE